MTTKYNFADLLQMKDLIDEEAKALAHLRQFNEEKQNLLNGLQIQSQKYTTQIEQQTIKYQELLKEHEKIVSQFPSISFMCEYTQWNTNNLIKGVSTENDVSTPIITNKNFNQLEIQLQRRKEMEQQVKLNAAKIDEFINKYINYNK